MPRYAHVTQLFHELYWLLIDFQLQFKVLVISYKVLHGLGLIVVCGTAYFQ